MISFVCWKWRGPNPARAFSALHVNVLAAMVRRHYPLPHRFICITDDPAGLSASIEVHPMPAQTFDDLTSPHGERFPSCYRRLWVFSKEAQQLGERIFCLDIDCVIVGALAPLVDRPEPFVGWCDERFRAPKIAGGCYLLRTGAMPHVWEQFSPTASPQLARDQGFGGSDQGWMGYSMWPPPGAWRQDAGLLKIGWTVRRAKAPPTGSRIVFTNGLSPPWTSDTQRSYPWIAQHWRA